MHHIQQKRPLAILLATTLASGALSVGAATAWGADTAAGANTTAASGDTLAEITVSALKISVDVMHASVSVTAINGDDLQRSQVHNTVDLQAYVPGLSVTNTVLNTNFNIRGVGSDFTSPQIGQGVPIYRDGLLVPPNEGDEPFWDLANVQVLRGPQGTLVGANSTGGAVFVNAVKPTLGDNHGYMQLGMANYHHLSAEGAVNLPISDTLAARVGIYYEKRDSYSKNLTPVNLANAFGVPSWPTRPEPGDLDMSSVRASLYWEPNDRFNALARMTYFQNNTGYAAEKPIPIASTTINGTEVPCPAPGSFFPANPATWGNVPPACGNAPFAPADPRTLAYAAPDTRLLESIWRESLEANYRLTDSGITATFLTGMADNAPRPTNENTASTNYTGGGSNRVHEITTTYEASVRSGTNDKLNWVVGFYDWHDPAFIHFTGTNASGGPIGVGPGYSTPSGGIYVDVKSDKVSWATFGNASYQFDPQWKVEVGLRETWDHNINPWQPCKNPPVPNCQGGDGDALYFMSPNPVNPLGPEVLPGGGFQNTGEEKDSFLTWRAALNYNLTPLQYLYTSVATGAKAGGIQNGNSNFAPEKDTSFEVGYKATLLDGHANLQVDGYYTKFTNMQISDTDLTTGQGSTFNAGSTNIYGFEFAGMVDVNNWRVNATASLSKSSFSIGHILNQDICNLDSACGSANGQCAAGVPNGTSGCFDYTTGGLAVDGKFYPWLENVSGLQLPFSPVFQASVSVAYDIHVGDSDLLTPGADFSHQGQQYAQIFDTPFDLMKARNNLNLKLGYTHDTWYAEAYATNVTDQTYAVAFDAQADEIFNAPREFGVRVHKTF